MQLEEIAVAALARSTEWGTSYPSARSVLYRRVAARTAQLGALAAAWNPDLAAVTAALPIDVDDLGTPIIDLTQLPTPPLSLLGVTVGDAGSSPFLPGQQVSIANPNDLDGCLPPSVEVENAGRTLRGREPELEFVGDVRLRYVPTPDALAPAPASDPASVGLPAAFHELLVIDLAQQLLAKTPGIAPDVRALFADALHGEEAALLAAYRDQVATYVPATVDRFARPTRLPDLIPSTPTQA